MECLAYDMTVHLGEEMRQSSVVAPIGAAEYQQRRQRVLADSNADLCLVMRPQSLFYLFGLVYWPSERPVVVAFDGSWAGAVVPRLEWESFIETVGIDDVVSYDDYPGLVEPMNLVRDLIEGRHVRRSSLVAADSPKFPGGAGYVGPRLDELSLPGTLGDCASTIEQLRLIKSPQELLILQESARLSDLAHAYLKRECRPGVSETVACARATALFSECELAALAGYDPGHPWITALITLRGQVGPAGAWPHATSHNLTIAQGDVVVTASMVYVHGYTVELERTMIVGEPSKAQSHWFGEMVSAQAVGVEAIGVGRACASVDSAVRSHFESAGLMEYWRHHTGHGLGVEVHESPFLDVGESAIIEAGMVFSVEPGIYVPGVGGFRHSDTVVVTDSGAVRLGSYPRQLEELICPAR